MDTLINIGITDHQCPLCHKHFAIEYAKESDPNTPIGMYCPGSDCGYTVAYKQERKAYEFKFMAEDLTREEAEEIHDVLAKRSPMRFVLSSEKVVFVQIKLNFIGMNEVEIDEDLLEDSDGEAEELS